MVAPPKPEPGRPGGAPDSRPAGQTTRCVRRGGTTALSSSLTTAFTAEDGTGMVQYLTNLTNSTY